MNRLSARELTAFVIATITAIITITNTEKTVSDTNAGIECLHLEPDFATLADISDEERWKDFSAECLVKGSSVTHRGTGVACKKRMCGGGYLSLEAHCLIKSRLNGGVTEIRFGCESGGMAPLKLTVDKMLIDGRSAYLSCATTDCNMLKARKQFAKQLQALTATTDTTTRSEEGGGGLKTAMAMYIISGVLAVVALLLFGSIMYIIMRTRKRAAKQEATTDGEDGEKREGDKDVEKAVVLDEQAGEKPEAQPAAEITDKTPDDDVKAKLKAQTKPAKKAEEENKENEKKEVKEEAIKDESKADQQSGKSASSKSGSGSEVSSRGKRVLAEKAEAAETMYSPTSSLLRVIGTQEQA